ncbi:hypothetical protein L3V83_13335 [Thiotrichales bacterium 19X7-9]|nr:hypothetical protein [Thiotrichales bacterium 19X7-9]
MPLTIDFGNEKLLLSEKHQTGTLAGKSEKELLVDQHGSTYVKKYFKDRKLKEIFVDQQDTFFNSMDDLFSQINLHEIGIPVDSYKEMTYQQFNKVLEHLDKAGFSQLPIVQEAQAVFNHIHNILLEQFCNEILFATLGSKLFPNTLAVPEVYLAYDEKEQKPFMLSKFFDHFDEFLHNKMKKLYPDDDLNDPKYWDEHKKPTVEALNLTDQEQYILGQLYAVALITGHYDVINNITMSNSGCVEMGDSAKRAAIVDLGPALGVAFSAKTSDELSAYNPGLFTQGKIGKSQVGGYEHIFPFDRAVYLGLPRQIIGNELFNFDNENFIKGFESALMDAKAVINTNPQLINESVEQARELMVSGTDDSLYTQKPLTTYGKAVFDDAFYQSTPGDDTKDNLSNILENRVDCLCHDLEVIKHAEQGHRTEAIERINQDRVRLYQSVQPDGPEAVFMIKGQKTQEQAIVNQRQPL